LSHVEEALRRDLGDAPAWLRKTAGEPRLPVLVVLVLAIGLQFALSARYLLGPRPLIPALEAALLVALTIANPRRLTRETTTLRLGSLALTALLSLTNAISAGLLVHDLVVVKGAADNAGSLLTNGAAIYFTNIVAFALWWLFVLAVGVSVTRRAGGCRG
jgi:hypothetical protein